MMKTKHFLFLFISLIFIFSCNTEAKFGFRKKVKVENHSTAKTIAKPHIIKHEIKVDNIDTCDIITASIDDEKIILPKIQQQKILNEKSFSIKKVVPQSIDEKNKIPLHSKNFNNSDINNAALLGFGISVLELLAILIGLFMFPIVVIIFIVLVLGILSFIISLIVLIQILSNRRNYRGLGYAIMGLTLGLISILFLISLYYFLKNNDPLFALYF